MRANHPKTLCHPLGCEMSLVPAIFSLPKACRMNLPWNRSSIVYQELNGGHGILGCLLSPHCARPDWKRRLLRCYTANRRVPRSYDRTRRELDCGNSSDALLMNVFCYPAVLKRKTVGNLLASEPGLVGIGVRPGVPLLDGKLDRTEVDMS